MKLYGERESGNCLKVIYTADYLGISYQWIDVDFVYGGSRTGDFLRMNPLGQVPAIVLDDGSVIAQSNAILAYLAEGTPLLPAGPVQRAKVNELLFWEQNSHEPYLAMCHFDMFYLGKSKTERDPWRVECGEKALDVLETLLDEKQWLVGEGMTIADIALVAYTRVADKGGFDLSARPNVRGWVQRCEDALGL